VSEYAHQVTRLARPIGSRLGYLEVELTERCDNDCIHCCINLAAGDAAARAREMSTEQVESILQQAVDLGCLEVRFTGGEPLLRSDFEHLYLFARRLGLRVSISTNARRITAHLAGLWVRVPPMAAIGVTAYGMRQESYEAVTRTRGSFAQFRRGIELMVENGVAFVVTGALLPPNRLETEEFEEWALALPWMERRPSYAMFFELRSRRDNPAKNRLIRSVRVSPEQGLAMLSRDEARYRAEMADFASRFTASPSDRLFVCGAGHGVTVDAYGRAQPCMGVRTPALTVDILTSSLSEALERFIDLSALRATNPEYLRRCAVCVLRGFCGQCPAKSWAEHGTVDTPVEYFCRVAHVQARYLGWLDEDENGWEVLRLGHARC